MKIYVDEAPSTCRDCLFCKDMGGKSDYWIYECILLDLRPRDDSKLTNCPLVEFKQVEMSQ